MKKISFNDNWTFQSGDGGMVPVRIPHDAMLHEQRDPDSKGGGACAFFPGNIYEYEKRWTVPSEMDGQSLILLFDGVYQRSRVFVNDRELGGCVYGYVPFMVDVTETIKPGEENVIRVIADNSQQPNSRWYSGGGIYRSVWLLEGGRDHIAPFGVRVSTPSYSPVRIQVDTDLCLTAPAAGRSLKVEILDTAAGQTEISSAVLEVPGEDIPAEGSRVRAEFRPKEVELWSEDNPKLYLCRVTLYDRDGGILDQAETRFGVRTIAAGPRGLFINGQETLLRGGCVHHDNGILGSVSEEEAEWRRVKRLKEAGYNAIRSAHNPASPFMLEAADALGMYIMDETWDMWYQHKNPKDYAGDFRENFENDVKAMVLRDYNHPSVILYSIGNEISEPAKPEGVEMGRRIVAEIKQYDTTRPVTAGLNLAIISQSAKGKGIYDGENGRDTSAEKKTQGMNSTMFNLLTSIVGTGMVKAGNSKKVDAITTPICDAVDVAGYNYGTGRYPLEKKCHPGRVLVGSETFPQMIAKNWKYVESLPYLVGDFMWTSWDYLGETGIGTWGYTEDSKGFEKSYPWLLADVGAMDILGNPTGELYMAQAAWHQRKAPAMAVCPVNHPGVTPAKGAWRGTNAIPSWSWENCQGNKAQVEVYTEEPSVTLFLNGKKIGTAKTRANVAKFHTSYEPGELTAVTPSGEKVTLPSAEGPLQIRLTPEATSKDPSVLYVRVEITDAKGIIESNHDTLLTVSAEGGSLLGFGSANPRTEERFDGNTYSTYYGQAMAVVAKEAGRPVKLTVSGEGFETAEILL